MSPPGRPKGEYRRAKPAGTLMSPPGRPKGEYRRAQHEGTPVSLRHGGFIALHGNAGVSPVVGLVVLNHLRLCMTIQPTSPTTTSTRPGTQ